MTNSEALIGLVNGAALLLALSGQKTD